MTALEIAVGRRRVRVHGVLEGAGVFLVQLVAAVFATWPLARFATTHVPVNLGDPLLNAYVVGWGGHAIIRNPLRIFDASLYDPEPLSLAMLENMLGLSLPLAPLYWLTDDALLVTTIGLLVYPAVAGLGMYLLVRRLTASRGAAFVCALAYTVMPVRLSQIGHLHVYATYALPFVLLFLVRLGEDIPSRRRVVGRVAALAVATAACIWGSLTGGAFMALAAGGWGLWTLAQRPVPWVVLRRAFLGLGIGFILSLPVLLPYVVVRAQHPDYGHSEVVARTLSATPASYLAPPPGGEVVDDLYWNLSERFGDAQIYSEKQLFPGLWLSAAFVVSVVVVLRGRRQGLRVPVLGAIVAFIGVLFSLGPRWGGREDGVPLPFMVAELFGGLTRVPARMGAIVPLGMLIVVGWALSRSTRRWRTFFLVLSVAGLVIEMAPSSVVVVRAPQITEAHRAIADRGGVVLALPTTEVSPSGQVLGETLARDTQHLYLSTANFARLVNGYGAYAPPPYWEVVHAVQEFPSLKAFTVFQRHDVRTIVVQTDLLPGSTRWTDVVQQLEAWPGVRLIDTGPGVRVYDVTLPSDTEPA